MDKYHSICIPDIVVQTYATFHLVGLWTNKDTVSIQQYIRFAYFALVMVSISIEALSSDIADEKVFLIVTTLVGTVQLCKMYCLIWNQKDIKKITGESGVHSTDNYEVFFSATKKLKNGVLLFKVFDAYIVVALATVIIVPIATGRNIFNIAFPLDYENNEIAFWMAYTFLLLGFVLSIVCCMLAPIVWYLMMNLIIKYEILGSQFKRVFNVKPEETELRRKLKTAEQNGLLQKQFVDAIRSHEETIEIIEQFALTFSSLFLLQIVTSSICICGTIYTLAFSNHENLLQDLFYTAVLFYSFVDIFMLMYLGNEITQSSDRLSYCIYESNWIDQAESTKRLLLIVVERLKKPHELIVGKLFPLNLKSFDLIVHRAYSMFNILLKFRK